MFLLSKFLLLRSVILLGMLKGLLVGWLLLLLLLIGFLLLVSLPFISGRHLILQFRCGSCLPQSSNSNLGHFLGITHLLVVGVVRFVVLIIVDGLLGRYVQSVIFHLMLLLLFAVIVVLVDSRNLRTCILPDHLLATKGLLVG